MVTLNGAGGYVFEIVVQCYVGGMIRFNYLSTGNGTSKAGSREKELQHLTGGGLTVDHGRLTQLIGSPIDIAVNIYLCPQRKLKIGRRHDISSIVSRCSPMLV